MNTTIRTMDIRCQEVLPPDYLGLFALVEVDDGRGLLSIGVHPEGVTRARELAAMLNAAADAVEAEQERRERAHGAVPIESLAPEAVDPVEVGT